MIYISFNKDKYDDLQELDFNIDDNIEIDITFIDHNGKYFIKKYDMIGFDDTYKLFTYKFLNCIYCYISFRKDIDNMKSLEYFVRHRVIKDYERYPFVNKIKSVIMGSLKGVRNVKKLSLFRYISFF